MNKIFTGLFLVFILIMFLTVLKSYLRSRPKKLILRSVPLPSKPRSHGVAMDVMLEPLSVPVRSIPAVPVSLASPFITSVPSPVVDVPVFPSVDSSVPDVSHAPADISRYRRADFLTGPERRFLPALSAALAGRAHIMVKVRLADLAHPDLPHHTSAWHIAFNHIKSKHVDFVVCDSSFQPLCVIELDDSSHFQFKRVKRDQLVDKVLQDVGLPIFHIHTKSSYSPGDFKALDSVLNLR